MKEIIRNYLDEASDAVAKGHTKKAIEWLIEAVSLLNKQADDTEKADQKT